MNDVSTEAIENSPSISPEATTQAAEPTDNPMKSAFKFLDADPLWYLRKTKAQLKKERKKERELEEQRLHGSTEWVDDFSGLTKTLEDISTIGLLHLLKETRNLEKALKEGKINSEFKLEQK